MDSKSVAEQITILRRTIDKNIEEYNKLADRDYQDRLIVIYEGEYHKGASPAINPDGWYSSGSSC
jgi:hypothetical protein